MQPDDDFYRDQALQFIDLSTRNVEEVATLFWAWCESKDLDGADMKAIWRYVEAALAYEKAEAATE
jgi:hypothetical protein